jgi:hypothetical protein
MYESSATLELYKEIVVELEKQMKCQRDNLEVEFKKHATTNEQLHKEELEDLKLAHSQEHNS